VDNCFKIITPFYNAEKWLSFCINSVKKQKYKNYQHIIINDCSTDNSLEKIKSLTFNEERVKLLNTEKNGGALATAFFGISQSELKDEDIIVILDGDDWFSSEETLKILNDVYNEQDCWMTYGSYVEYPGYKPGKFSRKIPENIIKNNLYRESEYMSSHLRSFKYKLWKKIIEDDLKNNEDIFYPSAGDVAVMFPMLEMSGNKAFFIDKILYVYNRENPLNDDKIDNKKQIMFEREIRLKNKYRTLEEL